MAPYEFTRALSQSTTAPGLEPQMFIVSAVLVARSPRSMGRQGLFLEASLCLHMVSSVPVSQYLLIRTPGMLDEGLP